MRAALFAPMYLDGVDPFGTPRLKRNRLYIEHYLQLRQRLGFERIYFADNGSSPSMLHALGATIVYDNGRPNLEGNGIVHVYHYSQHLSGGGFRLYPYCWRALYHIKKLIEMGYQKIIMIDSDGYIVSRRLVDYILDLKSGWTSFYCKRHSFPESSIHVLCEDAFSIYHEFTSIPYMAHMGKLMEISLPFTHVERGFDTDRYGEFSQEQPPGCDYFGQWHEGIKIDFGRDH